LFFALSFVGEHPDLSVFAQANHVAAIPKRVSGQIKQSIHLVSSRRDLLKPKLLKARDQALRVRNAEFDFNFERGRHQRQYIRTRASLDLN
jgi:hypothetical protein